jgi:hypothetical protein
MSQVQCLESTLSKYSAAFCYLLLLTELRSKLQQMHKYIPVDRLAHTASHPANHQQHQQQRQTLLLLLPPAAAAAAAVPSPPSHAAQQQPHLDGCGKQQLPSSLLTEADCQMHLLLPLLLLLERELPWLVSRAAAAAVRHQRAEQVYQVVTEVETLLLLLLHQHCF